MPGCLTLKLFDRATKVTNTAINAWVDSPLLPDLHRRRYTIQNKAALDNNEHNLEKLLHSKVMFISLWSAKDRWSAAVRQVVCRRFRNSNIAKIVADTECMKNAPINVC
jgi:hypothetical protein